VTIDAVTQTLPLSGVSQLLLAMGGGADSVSIGAGVPAITIAGGAGRDTIISAADFSVIRGGKGRDLLIARGANIGVFGGKGADTLGAGHNSGVSLFGGGGADVFLNAGGSGDLIDGGAGLNLAQLNTGDIMDNIFEIYDPNPLSATPALATDTVSGALQIFGTTGDDNIELSTDGSGNLLINGSSPTPEAGLTGILLAGGLGNDTLTVDPSVLLPVTLRGGQGNDSLTGGGGDNVIAGGAGSDTLVGGREPIF
jgi:Ca2+-binding RTX toxin-like protein